MSFATWRANLMLFGAALLICLLIGEVGARLMGMGVKRDEGFAELIAYDDTLGWRGVSNARQIHRFGEQRIEIRTNEWGFRDVSFSSTEESSGKRNVLFLGDSFLWGFGVEQDRRITEFMESFDPTLKTCNTGMWGYGTDQELLVLKMYGEWIKPDAVVLLFCLNDLVYNDSDVAHRMSKPHFEVLPDGSVKLGNVPVPYRHPSRALMQWLRSHFALFNALEIGFLKAQMQLGLKKQGRLLKRAERRIAGSLEGGIEDEVGQSGQYRYDRGGLTVALLKAVHDECRRIEAPLAVVMVPSSSKWTERHAGTPAEAEAVLEHCEDMGITTLNLYPVFRQHHEGTGEFLFVEQSDDVMHWNAAGHRLAASTLYPVLKNLLEPAQAVDRAE